MCTFTAWQREGTAVLAIRITSTLCFYTGTLGLQMPGHWAPTHQLCMKPKTGLNLPHQAHCPADKYIPSQSFQHGITWLHRITEKYHLWVRSHQLKYHSPEDVRSICCMDTGFPRCRQELSLKSHVNSREKRAFNSFLVAILGKQMEELFEAITKPKICAF